MEKHKRRFPTLAALHDHRELLRAWAEQGRALGQTALAKFSKTLGNWMTGSANYFVTRPSNGRTEGFNRGLRAVLWRACGMTNFAHFRLRVLHGLGRRPTQQSADVAESPKSRSSRSRCPAADGRPRRPSRTRALLDERLEDRVQHVGLPAGPERPPRLGRRRGKT